MSDVGKGPAVHEAGLPLQGLDEVGLESLLEEYRHRARGLEVLGGHGLSLVGEADGDGSQPGAEIVEILCDRKDRHDLGGSGDIKACLPGVAVGAAPEADD